MKYWKCLEITTQNQTYKVKGRGKDSLPYEFESDEIITFDTECTSAFYDIKTNKIETYTKGKSEDYWNSKLPICVCYIWMLYYQNEVYYGRELSEFVQCLSRFYKNTHYIIYIHNMGYDFSFLQDYLTFTNVFGREERHPMKSICDEFQNIEFRCSYALTGLSLESWGKKIGLKKSVGDLDYNKMRTPLTQLTEKELGYCERDVRVQARGLEYYLKKYKHIKDIPLTQTGEIRREVKRRICKNKTLQRKLVKLIPQTTHMYDSMKKCFQGGYTHSNSLYVDCPVYGGCAYDFCSSYPTVMCSERFPMTRFEKSYFKNDDFDKYAYLLKVRYTKGKAKTFNHYISESKCFNCSYDDTWEVDNGRMIEFDYLETWITEQDYLLIKKTYTYKSMEVLECYKSKKDYLPRELVEYVLELYEQKTKYKDVKGMEDIYNQSKQFLNSLFGMCVTDFVYDTITYDNYEWNTQAQTKEEVQEYLNDLTGFNKNRTFLAYQWGLWITAYARMNLWECLLTCDKDVIYCDTDSLKIRNEYSFDWYNVKVTNKLKEACTHHNIDFNKTRPITPNGQVKPLGVFSREDDWSEFKTLGAKRYVYRSKKDNELHLTVSGINKESVKVLNNDINNFNFDTVFDKDAEGVKKNLRVYCDEMPIITYPDGYVSCQVHGTVLRPTSYSMSVTDEFFELVCSMGILRNKLRCIG